MPTHAPRVRPGVRGPVFAEQKIALANRIASRVAFALGIVIGVAFLVGRGVVLAPGALSEDASDFAQVARHVARGEGYSTSAAPPLAAALGLPLGAGPEVTRAPLFPVVLAATMKVRPNDDRVVRAMSCLGLLLCLGLVYWASARTFGRPTAALAVALGLLNPGVLEVASSGTGSAWAAAMLAAAVACSALLLPRAGDTSEATDPAPRGRSWAAPVLIGLFAGMAYLAEYALLLAAVALVAWTAFAVPRHVRWRTLALSAAGMLVVAAPWWVRNLHVVRSPFFTLDRYAAMLLTDTFPGTTVFRSVSYPGNPYLFLVRHPQAMLANLVRLGAGIQGQLALAVGVVPLVGVLLLFLSPLRGELDSRWRSLFVCLALAIVASTGLLMPFAAANYVPLLPLLCILGAVFLRRLLEGLSGRARAVTAVVLALALVGPVVRVGLTPSRTEGDAMAPSAANLRALAPQAPPDLVVLTDAPRLAAWYLDRPAVWLPAGERDMTAVQQALAGRPVAFFLTRRLAQWPPHEGAAPYQGLLMGAPPKGLQDVPLPYRGDRLLRPGSADGAPAG